MLLSFFFFFFFFAEQTHHKHITKTTVTNMTILHEWQMLVQVGGLFIAGSFEHISDKTLFW